MGTLIKDKRVIVTGGAKGMGFEDCYLLLKKGAKQVAVLDLETSEGSATVEKFNKEFGSNRAFFISTDVSNADKFEESFKKAVEKLGGLDIMINNAGILDDLQWSLEIDVNFKGVVKGTLLAIEAMGKNYDKNGGLVVNVASIAALMPSVKSLPIYAATKHAVLSFSNTIAEYYEKTGVAVKVICPHLTSTDMITKSSLKSFDFVEVEEVLTIRDRNLCHKPEDVAKILIRLIEETPNGTVWTIDREKRTCVVNFPDLSSITIPV